MSTPTCNHWLRTGAAIKILLAIYIVWLLIAAGVPAESPALNGIRTADLNTEPTYITDDFVLIPALAAGQYNDGSHAPYRIIATRAAVSVVKACPEDYPNGFYMDITYQIFTPHVHGSKRSSDNLSCWERITEVSVDGYQQPGLSSGWTKNGCGITDFKGQFHDNPVGYCSLRPSIYRATQEMKFVVDGVDHIVRTNHVVFVTSGRGAGRMTNGWDAMLSRR